MLVEQSLSKFITRGGVLEDTFWSPCLGLSLERVCPRPRNFFVSLASSLVSSTPPLFITAVYRKSTFTAQYLSWNSFSPQGLNTNLILNLTHRALAICFPERLPSELNKIKFILQTNGYPSRLNLPPNIIPSFLILIQPLDFIFYKILPVLCITMTVDSQFLPLAAFLFIYPLLKLYFHQNF